MRTTPASESAVAWRTSVPAVRSSAPVARTPPAPGARDRLLNGDLDFLRADPRAGDADLWFLALHGGGGEDGRLQAVLATLGRPVTGSGMVGCALAMDKELSKRLFRDAGIATPAWLTGEPSAAEVEERLGWPVVVKAANGGSSLRLELVRGPDEWPAAVERSQKALSKCSPARMSRWKLMSV